ncbi:MAG: class I SAM-dependent methyltransferase [Chitinophagales bacterium]|nr:class I SAM-dependent methyltransferase [Chitinophagales bacterium]
MDFPKENKKNILNDFYRPIRKHSDRIKLYEYISTKEKLIDAEIDYLEFGVYKAASFKWWMDTNKNAASKFYGFDTFEGLPESWGTYAQGDMHADLPLLEGNRHQFFKGLFQDTLYKFLETHSLGKRKMVIHMDADLFSSSLFVLTNLARLLKEGDIILFDEFNVPNHEFFAWKVFTESCYIKYELLGAVNNYYQVAFKIVR